MREEIWQSWWSDSKWNTRSSWSQGKWRETWSQTFCKKESLSRGSHAAHPCLGLDIDNFLQLTARTGDLIKTLVEAFGATVWWEFHAYGLRKGKERRSPMTGVASSS